MRKSYLPQNGFEIFMAGVLSSMMVFWGVAAFLKADLIGPIGSTVEDYTVVITDEIVENESENDEVTLSFAGHFGAEFSETAVIDGLHIEVVYPLGYVPSNPQIVNNSSGVLFDPVVFVELGDGRYRASITFKDLSSDSNEDYYDFIFEYAEFSEHTLEISGEVLLEDTMEVIELDPIEYLLTTEEPEEEIEDEEEESSGGGGGAGRDRDDEEEIFADEPEEYSLVCREETFYPGDHPFIDLEGHFSELHVAAMYNFGVVHGYPSAKGDVYMPDQPITRSEYLKIVMKMIDCNKMYDSLVTVFPDVEQKAWYRPYISSAYYAGIVNGYGDGMFRPDQPITRAEAIKILLGAVKMEIKKGEGKVFSDVGKHAWYVDHVETAYNNKIAKGYQPVSLNSNSEAVPYFSPNKFITRGEAAVILSNAACKNDFKCDLESFDMTGIF